MSKPTREQRERWRKLSNDIGEWRNKHKERLDAEFKQVMDILELMIKNNKSFDVAAYKIAQKYDVTESTIKDACTRRLKLSTKDFKTITKYPEDLMQLLKKRFPERIQEVKGILN